MRKTFNTLLVLLFLTIFTVNAQRVPKTQIRTFKPGVERGALLNEQSFIEQNSLRNDDEVNFKLKKYSSVKRNTSKYTTLNSENRAVILQEGFETENTDFAPPKGWIVDDFSFITYKNNDYFEVAHTGDWGAFTYGPGWMYKEVILTEGVNYNFSIWSRSDKGDSKIMIKLGNTALVDSMVTELVSTTQVANLYTELTKSFTVPVTGTYFLGVNAVETGTDKLYVDDIVIEELQPYDFSVLIPSGTAVFENTSYDYSVTIKNKGSNDDDFVVTKIGTPSWTYELFQADGSTALTNSITIPSGEDTTVIVRVTVPIGLTMGDKDISTFSVVSATGAKTKEFSITTTAIVPIDVPFSEAFTTFPVPFWTGFSGLLANPTVIEENSSKWAEDGFANDGKKGAARVYTYTSSASIVNEWLVTPPIRLGNEEYKLSFDLALTESFKTTVGELDDDDKFAVVVSIDNGVTWSLDNVILTYDKTHEFSLKEEVILDLTEYANNNIMIGFYLESTSPGSDEDLFIDNIVVEEIRENDLSISTLTMPKKMYPSNTYSMTVKVSNKGVGTQPAGAIVSFKSEGVVFGQVATTKELISGDSEVVGVKYLPETEGVFAIEAVLPDDEFIGNNKVSGSAVVFRKGLFLEDFEGQFLPYGWLESAVNENWLQLSGFDGMSASLSIDESGSEEMLITPKLKLDGSITELSYWAHDENGSFGYGNGIIQLKYSADGQSWTNIGDSAYLDGVNPAQFKVDLTSIANDDYYFAFVVTSTFAYEDYKSLIKIDDVTGPDLVLNSNDLRVVEINYDHDFIYDGDTKSISVKVENVGSSVQSNVDVNLLVDGVSVETKTLEFLGYNQTEMIEFGYSAVKGHHTVTVSVPTDDFDDNNAQSVELIVIEQGMLIEDFENEFPAVNWILDEQEVWMHWPDPFTGAWDGNHVAVAAGESSGTFESRLTSPKVVLTGNAGEELNFYTVLGNGHIGESSLDISYSADGKEFTSLNTNITLSENYQLCTVDLSSLPQGEYYLGFDATVTSNGEYSTLLVIDHITGPKLASTYTVNFDVTDGVNALEGATVNINGAEFVTDANGVATIELFNGDYPYSVSADGYTSKNGNITVANVEVNEEVALDAIIQEYDVKFIVTDGTNALEGATVNINSIDLITDANGVATIKLPSGDYSYSVSADGYASENGDITVVNAEVNEEVALNAIIQEYNVKFIVTDGTNTLEAATVNINSINLTTDDSGVATIKLSNGDYPYTVTMSNYETKTGSITVADADVLESVEISEVGIDNSTKNFRVYPNPTIGILNIVAEGTNQIIVINALGQVVHTGILDGNGTIDLSENTAGVYFIRFQSGDNVNTQRIILE